MCIWIDENYVVKLNSSMSSSVHCLHMHMCGCMHAWAQAHTHTHVCDNDTKCEHIPKCELNWIISEFPEKTHLSSWSFWHCCDLENTLVIKIAMHKFGSMPAFIMQNLRDCTLIAAARKKQQQKSHVKLFDTISWLARWTEKNWSLQTQDFFFLCASKTKAKSMPVLLLHLHSV